MTSHHIQEVKMEEKMESFPHLNWVRHYNALSCGQGESQSLRRFWPSVEQTNQSNAHSQRAAVVTADITHWAMPLKTYISNTQILQDGL